MGVHACELVCICVGVACREVCAAAMVCCVLAHQLLLIHHAAAQLSIGCC